MYVTLLILVRSLDTSLPIMFSILSNNFFNFEEHLRSFIINMNIFINSINVSIIFHVFDIILKIRYLPSNTSDNN